MAYEGFLRFGGNEIVNNERARGYSQSGDCPMYWLKGPRCDSLRDALGEAPYIAANMPDAPWYDLSMPDVTGRFYGVFGLSVSGLNDSTRSAPIVEGIDDGAQIGRTRKGSRQVRARAILLAKGRDALDYGVAWMNAAMDPGACGQHGAGCGTTDLEFLTDCPPERGTVPDFSAWSLDATNAATNPSFEAGGSAVEVRRNYNVNPRLANSITGWATTASVATLTATAAGGQVDVTAGPTTAPLFFQAFDVSVAAGDRWASSMELTVPVGYPAASVQLRNYAYGMNSVVGASPVVTIQPGTTVTITAPSTDPLTAAATGIRSILYANGTPTGVRIIARNALMEKVITPGRYFDGATRPKVRRNLALNPRATTSSGWLSNNGATNPLVRGVAPSVPHPLGITTVAEQSSTGTNSTLGTVYNFDSLANAGTPARALGMWVLVTEPGYRVGANNGWVGSDELPVNQWTFVKNGTAAAGAYAIVTIQKTSGNASTTARVQMTGALVEEDASVVGDYFDGGVGATPGYGVAWDGAALSSASHVYDVDLSAAWTSTADASPSILTGVSVVGVVSGGVVAYQSSRWVGSGIRSMRIATTTGAAGSTYTILRSLVAADAGKTITLLIKVHVEAPTSGGAFARSLFITTNGTPTTIQGPQAPNVAGDHIVRWTVTLPAGMTAGTVRFYHGGPASDPDIWADDFAFIDGTYDGDFFYGSSTPADPEVERFAWLGAVNASASTRETRSRINRPQTDAEYAAIVEPFRRFLHNVAVTSGPYERELMNKGEYWAQVFEWTFTAGRPWIYSTTRPVALPITPTVVIQDTPYNLAPYPSAELATAGAVDVATNYSANPSLETNATSWASSASALTGTSPATYFSSGRVTGELAANGLASFRARLLGNGSTEVASSTARVATEHIVTFTPGAQRVSFTGWAAGLITGGAGVSAITAMRAEAQWYIGVNPTGAAVDLGSASPAEISGRVFALKSQVPPVGATSVRVRFLFDVTWRSSATPANNSDIRLYSDAVGVTIP